MSGNQSSTAGVAVPDTKLARDATELIRDRTSDLVYHHSRRVYFWGSLQGRNRGLSWDPELLYIGAMFHDLGLNEEFRRSSRRFEVSSADEARSFLHGHGVPEDSVRRVWTAIALHTTPGIPEFMERDVSDADRAAVTALHPRPDFKRQILRAFNDGFAPRPDTTFGTVNADVLDRFVPGFKRGNFVEIIEGSDWPE
jgi:hypothetical protein